MPRGRAARLDRRLPGELSQITRSDVLDSLDQHERIRTVAVDVEDRSKLVDLLSGPFEVLNATPFHLTTRIAEAALAARTHYLDLTEDVASMRRVRELPA